MVVKMLGLLYLLALLPALTLQAAVVHPSACSKDIEVKIAASKLTQGVYAQKALKQLKPMCKCLIEQNDKAKKAQYSKCHNDIPWYLRKFPKDKLATACRCVDELCPVKATSTTTKKTSTSTRKTSTTKKPTASSYKASTTKKPTTTTKKSSTTTKKTSTTTKSSSSVVRTSSTTRTTSSTTSRSSSVSSSSTSTGSQTSSTSGSGSIVSSTSSSSSSSSSSTSSTSSSTSATTPSVITGSPVEVGNPSETDPPFVTPKVDSYDECMFDPNDAGKTFTLLDSSDGVPYIDMGGFARKAQEVVDPIPEFHFVAPAGAPSGIFDAKMGDSYLAVQDNGRVIFTTSSSNGQEFVTRDGSTFITSLFSLDCDGIMTFGIADAFPFEFGSIDDTGYLYARPDCPDCDAAFAAGEIGSSSSSSSSSAPAPTRRRLVRRWRLANFAQQVFEIARRAQAEENALTGWNALRFVTVPSPNNRAQVGRDPRCPSSPFGLVATVKPGARPVQTNGCGPDNGLKYLVPNFNFEGCCNTHDRCFDDCSEVFEDCNERFRQCDLSACDSSFPRKPITIFGFDTGGDYNSVPRWGCKNVANFYGDTVGSFIGVSAFDSSTRDRCQCGCPENTANCNGRCTPILNDANNCGACGNRCSSGVCDGYSCGCPLGQKLCNGQCINAFTDPNNCGGCGNACASGQCSNGACVCTSSEQRCGGARYGLCTNTASSVVNCGSCGAACPLGASCSGGQCHCPAGQIACGNACVDPGTDASNCGGCGAKCATGGLCSGAECRCPTGQTVCGNTCVDLKADRDNCGSCGNSCPSGFCREGECVATPDECKRENFKNYGNILPVYVDIDDMGSGADDMADLFASTREYDTTITDKVRCCSKCYLHEGGGCIFFAMNSNGCDWAYQSTESTKKSLPKPWPDMCPLGGISMRGYGPGQGTDNGFSAENGPCGSDF